jgi:PAS domain S-box-containing protein
MNSPTLITKTPSPKRSLSYGYTATLIVLLLLILGSGGIHYWLTQAQAAYATRSAFNSRQLAATQTVALLATRWANSSNSTERLALRQSLQEHVTLLEQTHNDLLNGNPALGLPAAGAQSAALEALYRTEPVQLDKRTRDYIGKAKSLLLASNDALSPAQPELAELVNSAAALPSALELALNHAVVAEQTLAMQLRNYSFIEWGFTLSLLLAVTLLIFRPLVKRSEELMRQKTHLQNQLDNVFNTVGEAIVTMDIDSQIVRVNQEVELIWNYTAHELVGQRIQILFSPRYRDSRYDASDIRVVGRRTELEGMKRDGTIFPLEIHVTKTSADGKVLFTGAMRDISERKRTEAKIQYQLETIQALYTSAQKLAASLDTASLAADITRTCVELFGARMAWLGRAEDDGTVRLLDQCPASARLPQQITAHWDAPSDADNADPIGRAIRSGQPIVDAELNHAADSYPWRKAAFLAGFRSMAAVPLISRDRPFGALTLYHEQAHFFTPERIEFFQNYAHQAAAALENARLFADDHRRLERMQALRAVDAAIRASLDLSVTLNIVLDQVITHLKVDAAVVLLFDPQMQMLSHASNRGFIYNTITRSRLRLGRGHAGTAALERRLISVPNLNDTPDDPTRTPLYAGENFIAYVAVPLIAKGNVKGVLEIFQRAVLKTDSEWQEFLEALAAQTAIAIDNATLFAELQHSNDELKLAYDSTLEGWSRAVDLRDQDTEAHTRRVTDMAVQLAHLIGLSNEEIVHIQRGALLHDIGKMGIPDNILLKPSKLTDEEYEIMKRHPQYAFDMLYPIAFLRPALDIPYCHHEKWDGTGYPRGLKGEQIPLAARIFAVVDVWDALAFDRPYRRAWPLEKVMEHIQSQAGTHFDSRVVNIFIRLLRGE